MYVWMENSEFTKINESKSKQTILNKHILFLKELSQIRPSAFKLGARGVH